MGKETHASKDGWKRPSMGKTKHFGPALRLQLECLYPAGEFLGSVPSSAANSSFLPWQTLGTAGITQGFLPPATHVGDVD